MPILLNIYNLYIIIIVVVVIIMIIIIIIIIRNKLRIDNYSLSSQKLV